MAQQTKACVHFARLALLRWLRTVIMVGLGFGTSLVWGQGYQTKFKEVGFKPGEAYHSEEGVHVSLNGGGLEVTLPLGPALPGPLPLRPLVSYHGKLSQSLNPEWRWGAYYEAFGYAVIDPNFPMDWWEANFRRWSPPSIPSGGIHPGKLILRRADVYAESCEGDVLSITSPLGVQTTFYESGPGMKQLTGANDASEVRSVLSAIAPEWPYSSTWGTPNTGSSGMRIGTGTYLIYGPVDHAITYTRDLYTDGGVSRDTKTLVPTQILEVSGEYITLWEHSRNSYQVHKDGLWGKTTGWDQMIWKGSVYHPKWIKLRNGFKVQVSVVRGVPKDFPADTERGLLQGFTISYTTPEGKAVGYTVDSTSATPVTYFGLPGDNSSSGYGLGGATPARVWNSNSPGWQPGTTIGWESYGIEKRYDAEFLSDELGFGGSTITQGGLSMSLEWNGPAGLLSKLTTPSGKTYQFTYEMKQGVGVQPPSSGRIRGWNYNALTPEALEFWSVVTQMDVADGVANQVRTTRYQWLLPLPNKVKSNQPDQWTWATTQTGVAQTLPDGQTVLHVFASPVNLTGDILPNPGNYTEEWAKTFMAQRQATVARYNYAAGDSSWQSFFTGSAGAPAGWVGRELREGWDLRGWEGSLSLILANVEPRPTREIKEVAGGPVNVTESDDWDPATNQYRVQRSYVLAPGTTPTAAPWAPGVFTSSTSTTFLPNPGTSESPASGSMHHLVFQTAFATPKEWLFARPELVQGRQVLAPTTGQAGGLVPTRLAYEAGPGKAHVVASKRQLATDGSTSYLDLTFNNQSQGLFTTNLLKGVTVQGTAANGAAGTVGVTYDYTGTTDGSADSSGRFITQIQPLGVTWNVKESAHDGFGRPLTQTDANNYSTQMAWDTFGRITGMTPPNSEVGLAVSYGNFAGKPLRKATRTRGQQVSNYFYNGFGELIGEDRLGEAGSYSHRIYAYDTAGRKVFESVWRPGAFTETQGSDWTTPGIESTTIVVGTYTVCSKYGIDPDTGDPICLQYKTITQTQTINTTIKGTFYAYDARGRLVRVTNPNGEVVETRYDIDGNPLKYQLVKAPGTSDQTITTFEKDVLGKLVKVTDAKGQVTTYGYDAQGRVIWVVQSDTATGANQVRNWFYDGLGRLVVLDQPESGVTYFTSFTVTGKAMEVVYGLPRGWRPTDANSRDTSAFSIAGVKTLTYAFDSQDRVVSIRSSDNSVTQDFVYDTATNGKGKLTSATANGVGRSFEYLGLNGRPSKLTRTVDGFTFAQGLSYDLYGHQTGRTYPGRTAPATTGMAQGIGVDVVRGIPTSTTYNGQALLSQLGYDTTSWALIQMTYANSATANFTYDNDQARLKTMRMVAPGKLDQSWTYAYNLRGLLLSDSEDVYQYDELDRLSDAVVRDPFNTGNLNAAVHQAFEYDAFGNRKALKSEEVTRTSATAYSVNGASSRFSNYQLNPADAALVFRNQLPIKTATNADTGAQYDILGNLTQIYKAIGDPSQQLTLGYDALSRVRTMIDSKRGTTETYLHDDEGLRIKVTDSATGKVTYNIYNEARQLIAQYEKAAGATTPTWKRDIVYVGTKEVAEVDKDGTEITFVDHLGSPRYAWRGGTTPVIKQKFLPFGESLTDPTTAKSFAKGFTNHEQTDPSGLIYMQARFYAPWYGRFLSPDPARDQHFEQTQSWNIYSYVQNSPTMRIDPTGMVAGDIGDWISKAYDKALDTAAAAHVGMQKVPFVGPVYSAGARLGEAIGGSRVEYSSRENGPRVVDLSIDEMKTAAKQGTIGIAPVIVGGGFQLATPTLTATLPSIQAGSGGTLAIATVQLTTSTGNLAGALAIPAVASSNTGGSPGGGSSGSPSPAGKDPVLQTGGNGITSRTAAGLNRTFGENLSRREWGRALEALKGDNGLAPNHHGAIRASGDYVGRNGEVIGNIGDYIH